MISNLYHRIKRKLVKLRLQPIRVFCFHQTSESYDPDVYCKPDWIPLDFLKAYVGELQSEGYTFISLEEAHRHIKEDYIRTQKYAVLTADDGLQCQLHLVSWLKEHRIPVTLFVNIETLDGKTCSTQLKRYFRINDEASEMRHARQLFLTRKDLDTTSPIVSIAMHGINHDEVANLNRDDFKAVVDTCVKEIGSYPNYIPFYAYTYGKHSEITDAVLHQQNVTPVLADGGANYNDARVIHREVLEVIYRSK